MLLDGAIGIGVGAAIGGLAEVAESGTLIVASLLPAPSRDAGLECQPRWLAWRHRRHFNWSVPDAGSKANSRY